MTVEIDIKNGKSKPIGFADFPSISTGSAIPRRVAPQQSPLPFHRTKEGNAGKISMQANKINKSNQNSVEVIWPDWK